MTFSATDLNDKKSSDYRYALKADEKTQLTTLRDHGIKPTIIAVYDKSHGKTYADVAIQHFEQKGIRVIKILSDATLNHPNFKFLHIDGIYLPDGPNKDLGRMELECELLQIAEKCDVPLLGIHRGLEAMAHHSGYEIATLPANSEHTTVPNQSMIRANNVAVVQPGSHLYEALQYKLRNENREAIAYPVVCLHEQHMIEHPENHKLKVTGKNQSDGLVESIEKPTGHYVSFALQHQPEAVLNFYEELASLDLDHEISRLENKLKHAIRHIKNVDEKIKQVEGEQVGYKLFGLKEDEWARLELRDHKEDRDKLNKCIEENTKLLEQYQNVKAEYKLNKYTKEEKTARAEFGLFTKQVKKHFLERQQEPKQSSSCVIS